MVRVLSQRSVQVRPPLTVYGLEDGLQIRRVLACTLTGCCAVFASLPHGAVRHLKPQVYVVLCVDQYFESCRIQVLPTPVTQTFVTPAQHKHMQHRLFRHAFELLSVQPACSIGWFVYAKQAFNCAYRLRARLRDVTV